MVLGGEGLSEELRSGRETRARRFDRHVPAGRYIASWPSFISSGAPSRPGGFAPVRRPPSSKLVGRGRPLLARPKVTSRLLGAKSVTEAASSSFDLLCDGTVAVDERHDHVGEGRPPTGLIYRGCQKPGSLTWRSRRVRRREGEAEPPRQGRGRWAAQSEGLPSRGNIKPEEFGGRGFGSRSASGSEVAVGGETPARGRRPAAQKTLSPPPPGEGRRAAGTSSRVARPISIARDGPRRASAAGEHFCCRALVGVVSASTVGDGRRRTSVEDLVEAPRQPHAVSGTISAALSESRKFYLLLRSAESGARCTSLLQRVVPAAADQTCPGRGPPIQDRLLAGIADQLVDEARNR